MSLFGYPQWYVDKLEEIARKHCKFLEIDPDEPRWTPDANGFARKRKNWINQAEIIDELRVEAAAVEELNAFIHDELFEEHVTEEDARLLGIDEDSINYHFHNPGLL